MLIQFVVDKLKEKNWLTPNHPLTLKYMWYKIYKKSGVLISWKDVDPSCIMLECLNHPIKLIICACEFWWVLWITWASYEPHNAGLLLALIVLNHSQSHKIKS